MPGGTETRQLLFAALMLADEMQEVRGKVEKTEPQSDSLRAAVALAESREAQARDELKAAIAREQEAIKALEAARQNSASRSEERRVGKECVSTGRSRWAP